MTSDTLGQITRDQIAKLHPMTKAEFRAWANNQLCILINNADLIAAGIGTEERRIEAAHAIARTGRKWHSELEQLFALRNPDSHLGSDKE